VLRTANNRRKTRIDAQMLNPPSGAVTLLDNNCASTAATFAAAELRPFQSALGADKVKKRGFGVDIVERKLSAIEPEG
jgi:hypothetical protein